MDSCERHRVRVWSVPVGLVVAAVFMAGWLPLYDAIVHGQITPILTGLLAFGIGRKPYIRGLVVGLTAALKPPFVILIPCISLSFGWKAFFGCLTTVPLALLPPRLFIDYLHLLPDLTQRAYGDIGLIRLLGADACIPLAILISIWIAIRWRETEVSYMACIAVTVLGTALWFHAYTPLILPAVFFTTQAIRRWKIPPSTAEPPIESETVHSVPNISSTTDS